MRRRGNASNVKDDGQEILRRTPSQTFLTIAWVLLASCISFAGGYYYRDALAIDVPSTASTIDSRHGTAAHAKRKAELLDHLSHKLHVRIGTSPREGAGVIAMHDIPPNTVIFHPLPNLLSEGCQHEQNQMVTLEEHEVEALPPVVRAMFKGFVSMAGSERRYITDPHGLAGMTVGDFLNHAAPPNDNVGVTMVQRPNSAPGMLTSAFTTSRLVRAGEELLIDYCVFGHGEQFDFDREYFAKCSGS
jgi:hypothetical protein